MSSFITKDDYADHIRSGYLDQITQLTDTKLDTAETKAISLMSGYLNNRYDVLNIFNKTGNARDPIILSYALDIAIYHLHKLSNYKSIPDFRKEAYMEAKEWLTEVSALRINPLGLPLIPSTGPQGQKDYILSGSNPKRINHLQ